jgi:hypothetical protein
MLQRFGSLNFSEITRYLKEHASDQLQGMDVDGLQESQIVCPVPEEELMAMDSEGDDDVSDTLQGDAAHSGGGAGERAAQGQAVARHDERERAAQPGQAATRRPRTRRGEPGPQLTTDTDRGTEQQVGLMSENVESLHEVRRIHLV